MFKYYVILLFSALIWTLDARNIRFDGIKHLPIPPSWLKQDADFKELQDIPIEVHQAFQDLKMAFKPTSQTTKQENNITLTEAAICTSCVAVATMLSKYLDIGFNIETYINTLTAVCNVFEVIGPESCAGLIRNGGVDLIYIYKIKKFSPEKFCGTMLQYYYCPTYQDDWSITVDLGKPPTAKTPITSSNQDGNKTVKILHISDIHLDPKYEEKSNTNCGEVLCCRSEDGPGLTLESRAGLWATSTAGSCDIPYRFIEETFRHINQQHPDISIVLMTGDLVHHAFWDITRENNINTIKTIYRLITKYFNHTKIYPVLGNHESNNTNSFGYDTIPDKQYSIQWLYDLVYEEWKDWIGHVATVKRGGFYSVSAGNGLRIIGLNTVLCYKFNWWLLYDNKDPYGQLDWLATELLLAETLDEKVYILGHVIPGTTDCLGIWSREYAKIINRFSVIIMGQYFGHEHEDRFKVYYNEANIPTNVLYAVGSLTTYPYNDPNYRVYTANTTNWELLNYESWLFNARNNNQSSVANSYWYKFYDANNLYGLKSLNPQEWSGLINRMKTNQTLFNIYYRNIYQNSSQLLKGACTHDCRTHILCDTFSMDPTDKNICDTNLRNATVLSEDSLPVKILNVLYYIFKNSTSYQNRTRCRF